MRKKWNSKKFLKTAVAGICILYCITGAVCPAYATDTSSITAKFDVLYDIVAAIISSIGMIVALWAISEFGMAMQGNEGTMQAHALRRLGGSMVWILAPQILPLLT